MSALDHGDRPVLDMRGSRSPVLGMNGMVATSQPLASAAGLRVLQDGGNAVDAAIAAAAVLNVVEPMSTGIGGDMFALVCMRQTGKPGAVEALNGSGWAGTKASVDYFRSRGLDGIPDGIHSVSVPGAVAGWFKLHGRYGTVPMSRLLDPAIGYAEYGFPVSEIIARQWEASEPLLGRQADATRAYLIAGRAPRHTETFRNPGLARSFRLIAEQGRDAFYEGEIARKIIELSDRNDGLLTKADLSAFDAQWVDPVFTSYRGHDVYEPGPNTQGITVLEMLNILEGFEMGRLKHNSADYVHLLIEAKRLAWADRDAYIADPDKVHVPVDRLISKKYAAERRRFIDRSRPQPAVRPGLREGGDTVYLTAVDKDRNAVSFINSLFESFGSGLVAGDTGIVLHNRGVLFELDPEHPNRVAPRKRPFHTLIPAMVMKDGRPFLSFGVVGGDMQPQGHVQALLNVVDFGMNVQRAGEAPRFRHFAEGVALESAFDEPARAGLVRKGHTIVSAFGVFGGFQGILIDPESGVLMGGSDVRKDGLAIAW